MKLGPLLPDCKKPLRSQVRVRQNGVLLCQIVRALQQKETEARFCTIVKQSWLLSFTKCLYCFGISQKQQFTTWADTSLSSNVSWCTMQQLEHLEAAKTIVGRSFSQNSMNGSQSAQLISKASLLNYEIQKQDLFQRVQGTPYSTELRLLSGTPTFGLYF